MPEPVLPLGTPVRARPSGAGLSESWVSDPPDGLPDEVTGELEGWVVITPQFTYFKHVVAGWDVDPESIEALDEEKHLPGEHDQDRHGGDDGPKLTKAAQKLLALITDADDARPILERDPSGVADHFDLDTVKERDVEAVRAALIQRTQRWAARKLPEQLEVHRGGKLFTDVVAVSIERSVARRHAEDYGGGGLLQSWTINREDILFAADAFPGDWNEGELLLERRVLEGEKHLPGRHDQQRHAGGFPALRAGSGARKRSIRAPVDDWERTKPWLASREDVESGRVPGLIYGRRPGGTEVASYLPDGRIRVSEDYFKNSQDLRRADLYHEAGHGLETDLTPEDYIELGFESPFDITNMPKARMLGHNYSEVLAEGYSALWTDPDWFKRHDAEALRDLVTRAAKKIGYPLPSGPGPKAATARPAKKFEPRMARAKRPFKVNLGAGYGSEEASVTMSDLKRNVAALAQSMAEERGLKAPEVKLFTDNFEYVDALNAGRQEGSPAVDWDAPDAREMGGAVYVSPAMTKELGTLARSYGSGWDDNQENPERPLAWRKLAHEVEHTLSGHGQGKFEYNSGLNPIVEEGGAEVLSIDYAMRRFGPSLKDTQWAEVYRENYEERVAGDEALVREHVYSDRVGEVIAQGIRRKGWDRAAVLEDIRQAFEGDEQARLEFFHDEQGNTVRYRNEGDYSHNGAADHERWVALEQEMTKRGLETVKFRTWTGDDPDWVRSRERAATLLTWLLHDSEARETLRAKPRPKAGEHRRAEDLHPELRSSLLEGYRAQLPKYGPTDSDLNRKSPDEVLHMARNGDLDAEYLRSILERPWEENVDAETRRLYGVTTPRLRPLGSPLAVRTLRRYVLAAEAANSERAFAPRLRRVLTHSKDGEEKAPHVESDHIAERYAEEVASVIEAEVERHPELRGHLRSVIIEKLPSTNTYADWTHVLGQVRVHSYWVDDGQAGNRPIDPRKVPLGQWGLSEEERERRWAEARVTIESQYANDVKAGFHPRGTEGHGLRAIVTHEIGHALHEQAKLEGTVDGKSFTPKLIEILQSHTVAPSVGRLSGADRPRSPSDLKVLMNDVNVKHLISKYAFSNDAEMVAEAYAQYRLAPDSASELAKDIGRLVDEWSEASGRSQ